MPIITPCACGKKLRTQDDFAGKRIKCPACGTVVTVLAAPDDRPLLDAADEEQDTVELSAEQSRTLPPAKEPFWVNPAGNDTVVALTDTAVYVADLGEPALGAARQALERGDAVWKVLKEAKTIIAFDEVSEVRSDLRGSAVGITWRKDKAGSRIRTRVALADAKARDEMMDVLHERLGRGWKMQEVEESRLAAAAWPLFACCFLLFVCAFEFFFITPVPVAVLVISLILLAGCAGDLVFRLRKPPVFLTIARMHAR